VGKAFGAAKKRAVYRGRKSEAAAFLLAITAGLGSVSLPNAMKQDLRDTQDILLARTAPETGHSAQRNDIKFTVRGYTLDS
jgi:hypothetical protein